jgi:hypothetical protein
MYMAITHDGDFQPLAFDATGIRKPRMCAFQGFTKKEGLPDRCDGTTFVPAAFDDLVPFVDFVTNADDPTFQAGIATRVDVPNYLNWFVHAAAIRAADSYEKTAIHFHDPAQNSPWGVVVWDYNDSFGQAWDTRRRASTGDLAAGVPCIENSPPLVGCLTTNRLWQRLWDDPTWGPKMRARFGAAVRREISSSVVLAALDDMIRETEASARRDERKWSAAYLTYYKKAKMPRTDFTTYAQEVAYVREWITARWAYLQSVFP